MPSTSADAIADALAAVPDVSLSVIGVYAGNAGGQALVNVDGRQISMPALDNHWPIAGDRVRLLRVQQNYVLLGTVQQRSTVGRVSATGSPRCTVEYPTGSGVTALMGYPKNVTPAVNDVAIIDWDGEAAPTVIAIVTTAAGQSSPTAPVGPPVQTSFQQTFTAADSGSNQNGGWWTNLVYASASNKSAFFYGSKIADTIADGATIDRIRVFLSPTKNSGNQPRIGTHGYASKPGGVPTISNLTSLANVTGWVDLPTSFGDLLKTGAALGVGFDGAGFAIFKGTQSDGQAGALDISWHV